MQGFRITVTVRTDNDPAGNTYTYSEQSDVPASAFTQAVVTNLVKQAQANFRESFPHNHTLPTFLPTDAKVVEIDQ